MRAVIQRVVGAQVEVGGTQVADVTGPGLLIYLGVTHTDTPADALQLARKIWTLRIMRDELSASDLTAPCLVVSQFTLYADTRKGRRPTWQAAAPGPLSEPLYEEFCTQLRGLGAHVEQGVFGADMAVTSVNDGPVTIIIDTDA